MCKHLVEVPDDKSNIEMKCWRSLSTNNDRCRKQMSFCPGYVSKDEKPNKDQ